MNREDVRRAFVKLTEKGDITDIQRWVGQRITYHNTAMRSRANGRKDVLAVLERLKDSQATEVRVRDMSRTQRNQHHDTDTGFVVEISTKDKQATIILDLRFSTGDKLFAILALTRM